MFQVLIKENNLEYLIIFKNINRPSLKFIFFPSFLMHRVTPVKQGTRYSLVSWFLGPPFK